MRHGLPPPPHDPFDPKRMSRRFPILANLLLAGVVLMAVGLGYELMSIVYRGIGRPPQIVSHMLSCLVGLMVLRWTSRLVGSVLYRKTRAHGKKMNHMLDTTIEAMNRIAKGDFSVLVPVDGQGPFAELAESVNQMARQLGSMENLRQDFISNVSHEIQSPLTSISGFAALLKNDALSQKQREHYIDIIETEAKRLSKLSDNLLKLSSLESNMQPLADTSFSLHKQIENAVLMLEPQWAAKNLNLSLALAKITFVGDEALLSQVWINLIHNAVKFTPENGEIHISLAQVGENIVSSVTDSGAGIAPEDQMHIFERFYKADKARDRSLGGNGLGLSIVKKIVELHGGTIAVESEPGQGATFTVTLPVLTK